MSVGNLGSPSASRGVRPPENRCVLLLLRLLTHYVQSQHRLADDEKLPSPMETLRGTYIVCTVAWQAGLVKVRRQDPAGF